jgi:L-ascorbate metabolism protein UlaG (beta-lactamase superfamily)
MALTELRRNYTTIYVNHNVYENWGSGYVMANGDKAEVDDNITVEAVPAYNTTPAHMKFHPKGRDNGYILTIENLRIYVAGDTEDIPEMENIKDIDIAFLPCNQPYTMTVEQLVKAAKTIKPKVLFPYHYSDTPIRKVSMFLSGSGIDVRIRKYQ